MSSGTFTICAFAENSPGVLQRITILFTKRKLNIESLTVSETERKGISTFTIVVNAEHDLVQKIAKQIHRVIEVQDVFVSENKDLIFKELAFYKVTCADVATRAAIEKVTVQHQAGLIFSQEDYVVVERAGSEEQINALFTSLESFGMRQFVRTGRIAILKNDRVAQLTSAPSLESNFFANPD